MLKLFSRWRELRARNHRAVELTRSLWLEPLEERALLSATRFAAFGDYGLAGQPEADVAALVHSWNPNFIITMGDNNYETGLASTIDANVGQYYHDFISPYLGTYGAGATTNKFFPTLGRHDWGLTDPNPTGDQPYLDYFTGLPGNNGRYYTFTQGPVQFFALDSVGNEPDGTTSDSVQGQWLQAQLAASTATYKIVYFADPPYSSSNSFANADSRWPFQAWGATIVLSGHAHNYERLIEDNNFPYIVAGLGGEPEVIQFDTPVAGSHIRYNADFGALLVNADSSTQIQFQFITRTGQLIDTYTIPAPASQPGVTSSLHVATFPSPITAGVAGNFTVTALDGSGNVTPGYRGTIHFTSSDIQAGLPANYTFTAADNGAHTFSTTLKTAGTQSIIATDTATSSIAGSESTTVQPAAAASVRVTGLPSPIQAGVAGNLTVTALDAFGNVATGYRGTIHFTSSDSKAVLPGNYIFTAADAGVHTFSATLKTLGSQSLIATDTVTGSITATQTTTVQPANASNLLVAAFPSPIQAGVAGNFTVTA
ncbi:MAG TPA: metallophosphoesterase, partial [Pirellulales bacterium]|nr:metallophosphoesterase [Pirellulales bacterium]